MAGVNMPSVEGLVTVEELKNAVAKMTKELSWLLNNLDTRNLNYLSADIIDAGVLNAALVTIKSALEGNASITIDGTGMTINDGTRDTFKADINGKVTMTGAYIESATGFPKVIMDPDKELLGAYQSETSLISIYTPLESISPVIRFSFGGKDSYIFHDSDGGYVTMTSNDVGINISSLSFIELFGNPVKVLSWNAFQNNTTGRSLQQDLNNKATSGSSTGMSGSHNHGIPDGTILRTADGGTVTFYSAPQHSHSQT